MSSPKHRTPTRRELETLRVCAQGYSVQAAAERLGVAQGTVKNHLQSVYRKLEVGNRTEATMAALRLGLLRPEELVVLTDRATVVPGTSSNRHSIHQHLQGF